MKKATSTRQQLRRKCSDYLRLLRSVPSSTILPWRDCVGGSKMHGAKKHTTACCTQSSAPFPTHPTTHRQRRRPRTQTHAWMRQLSQDLRKLAESSEDDFLFIAADCMLYAFHSYSSTLHFFGHGEQRC